MITQNITIEDRKGITVLFDEWFLWFLHENKLTLSTPVKEYNGREYTIEDIYNALLKSVGLQNKIKPALEMLGSYGITPLQYFSDILGFYVDTGYIE